MHERPNDEVPRCPACGYKNLVGFTWKHDKYDDTYECLSCGSMFLGHDMLDWKPDPFFCEHEWVETGMQKSWCKRCDVDGMFDRVACKYYPDGKDYLYDLPF